MKSSTEFNAKWLRTIEVRVPEGWERIEQQINYIDPYFTHMVSTTHSWRQAYRTNELDPLKIRKLLSTHPDLAETKGQPDAGKRIAIAKFMLDVGWLQYAKDDVAQIEKDFRGGMPQAAKAELDSLKKEIDHATAALVVNEAELALARRPLSLRRRIARRVSREAGRCQADRDNHETDGDAQGGSGAIREWPPTAREVARRCHRADQIPAWRRCSGRADRIRLAQEDIAHAARHSRLGR